MTSLNADQFARAADVLRRNPRASMSEVARELGISRATLNRAFAGRAALIESISDHVLMEQESAQLDLDVDNWFTGDRDAEDVQLVRALFDRLAVLGPQVAFLLTSPEAAEAVSTSDRAKALDEQLDAAFDRGREAGIMRSAGPREWPRAALYALAFTASELVADGVLAPRDAGGLAWTTWWNGLDAGSHGS